MSLVYLNEIFNILFYNKNYILDRLIIDITNIIIIKSLIKIIIIYLYKKNLIVL